jgi:hypothetical protein
VHAAHVADELSQRERALRRLPLPYSLALRLRDAGISADVICQYVNGELAALDGLYRMAEATHPYVLSPLKGSQPVTPPGRYPPAPCSLD